MTNDAVLADVEAHPDRHGHAVSSVLLANATLAATTEPSLVAAILRYAYVVPGRATTPGDGPG